MSSYFQVTSDEPYATCSVEGVKISLGMHLFGESRFGIHLSMTRKVSSGITLESYAIVEKDYS
jgi:hypothetical protein